MAFSLKSLNREQYTNDTLRSAKSEATMLAKGRHTADGGAKRAGGGVADTNTDGSNKRARTAVDAFSALPTPFSLSSRRNTVSTSTRTSRQQTSAALGKGDKARPTKTSPDTETHAGESPAHKQVSGRRRQDDNEASCTDDLDMGTSGSDFDDEDGTEAVMEHLTPQLAGLYGRRNERAATTKRRAKSSKTLRFEHDNDILPASSKKVMPAATVHAEAEDEEEDDGEDLYTWDQPLKMLGKSKSQRYQKVDDSDSEFEFDIDDDHSFELDTPKPTKRRSTAATRTATSKKATASGGRYRGRGEPAQRADQQPPSSSRIRRSPPPAPPSAAAYDQPLSRDSNLSVKVINSAKMKRKQNKDSRPPAMFSDEEDYIASEQEDEVTAEEIAAAAEKEAKRRQEQEAAEHRHRYCHRKPRPGNKFNPFLLYCRKVRSEGTADLSLLSSREASKLLGQMWRELPQEEKQPFIRESERLKKELSENTESPNGLPPGVQVPPNCYILFCNENWTKYKDEDPKASFKDLNARISKAWKHLDEKTKRSYIDRAAKARREFAEQNPELVKTYYSNIGKKIKHTADNRKKFHEMLQRWYEEQ